MEIPAVKLTPPLRAVLGALHNAHGRKLAVSHISADARVSPATVRKHLATLGKAGLVQHVLAPSSEQLPPRLVYWLTHAGTAVAVGSRPAA